jgi:hypothetical protein
MNVDGTRCKNPPGCQYRKSFGLHSFFRQHIWRHVHNRQRADQPGATEMGRVSVGFIVTSRRWRRRTARHIRQLVPADQQAALTVPCSAKDATSICAALADAARVLADTELHAQTALTTTLGSVTKGRSALERGLVASLAKVLIASSGLSTKQLAQALRVVGVFVCTVSGRDLRRCTSLSDMMGTAGPATVRKTLKDELSSYVPA